MSGTIATRLAFALFFTADVFASDLDFVKENIYVSLRLPDTMCVTGEYFFAAKDGSALSTSVVYPFPVDSSIAFPHAIQVTDKEGPVAFRSHPEQAMILIPVTIGKGDTGTTIVVYRQRLKRNTGRYILTTTKSWQKPLGKSNYSVTVPSNTVLIFLSYESDTVYQKNGSLVYSFTKSDFMPARDLVFSFKRR
jgi:hypothetical protein